VELPFEITGKNKPKWLEITVQIALVFLLVGTTVNCRWRQR